MRILERYVVLEVGKTFAFALVALTFIFFVAGLYELFRQDLSLRQIAAVLPYAVPYALPFLIPIALLVGCTLGYGRLAADNEVLPILSGGIHLGAVIAPSVLFGAVLTAIVYGLNATLIPYWQFKKKELKRQFVESLLTLGKGENKRISNARTFHFFCRRYDGDHIEGIEVAYSPDPRRPGSEVLVSGLPGESSGFRPLLITAESGDVREDDLRGALVLTLRKVAITRFAPPGQRARAVAPAASEGAAAGSPRGPDLNGKEDAEMRTRVAQGAPYRGTAEVAEIVIPYEYRQRHRIHFKSNRALADMRSRLGAWRRYAEASARPPPGPAAMAESSGPVPQAAPEGACGPLGERVRAAASLAAGAALPGAGPGAAVGYAACASASPAPSLFRRVEARMRDIDGAIHERSALAFASLVFSIVGATVPLLLRANNRLVPFFVALAIVSVTFFLPFLAGRALSESENLHPIPALWSGVVLTAGAGAALFGGLVRR